MIETFACVCPGEQSARVDLKLPSKLRSVDPCMLLGLEVMIAESDLVRLVLVEVDVTLACHSGSGIRNSASAIVTPRRVGKLRCTVKNAGD
jgi:hypothetical protein